MPVSRKFLVVPMQPTPNGRLHIGHGAGPYLRADVLARQLRRDGHDVHVICGSDVYENWVLLSALKSGRPPENVCSSYHDLIDADLRNLGVGIDTWINPLDPAHHADYRFVHERLIEELAGRGAAKLRPERIPFSAGTGRCVIGVWLLGRCPNCNADVGGNCCEVCGYHFQPAEVVDPRSRLDEGPLRWNIRRSWFLDGADPDAVSDSVAAGSLRPQIAHVATRYIKQTGALIRLSQPGSWGLHSDLAGEGAVLSNTFYAFSLYCGEVYAKLRGTVNPFSRDSDVTTVAFFGVDNTIAGIVGPHALAAASGRLKPFDHVGVNEFLDLEGAKCSTSRNHAIWLGELLENSPVMADELRYYMAQQPLDTSPANFTAAGLVDAVNQLRRWQARELSPAVAEARAETDAVTVARLHSAVARQGAYLEPGTMSLPDAVTVLDEWASSRRLLGCGPAGPASWLQGLAILAEPIMPTLAAGVWRALGLPNRPATSIAGDHSLAPKTGSALPVRPPITAADVRPFLHLNGS